MGAGVHGSRPKQRNWRGRWRRTRPEEDLLAAGVGPLLVLPSEDRLWSCSSAMAARTQACPSACEAGQHGLRSVRKQIRREAGSVGSTWLPRWAFTERWAVGDQWNNPK